MIYNTGIGRFISEDLIGLVGGINVYAYVGNSPVDRTDPFGLTWVYHQKTDFVYYVWDSDPLHTIAVYEGSGYAGHNNGLNNPDSQYVSGDPKDPEGTNAGPLAQGMYTIGALQNNPANYNPSVIMLNSMRLTPDPSNDMHGRRGFLIHGSNDPTHQDSSQDCVVLPLPLRKKIGGSPDMRFKVVP